MSNNRILIDPKEFAYHFVDSLEKSDATKANMQDKAKEQLFAYLTAYVLIDQFNASEASTFLGKPDLDIENLSMVKFLELISEKSNFTPIQK